MDRSLFKKTFSDYHSCNLCLLYYCYIAVYKHIANIPLKLWVDHFSKSVHLFM